MGFFDNFSFNFSFGFGNKSQSVGAPTTEVPETQFTNEEVKIQTEAIYNYLKEQDAVKNTVDASTIDVPAEGGRSSINNQRSLVPNAFTPATTDFPLTALPVLESLAMWNRHISYAVDNIENLANTDFEIEFDETISEERAMQLKKHLMSSLNKWYGFSVGANSLINDLLRQLAIYGAISAEREPNENLREIKAIHLIPNHEIEFAYKQDEDVYIPLQKIRALGNVIIDQTQFPGYKVLNTETYKYIAMRRFRQEPYGIPGFLSAIQDIIIENDMIKGFQEMMKRLGMLGFLAILVDMPAKDTAQGESDSAYRTRLQEYLKLNHERAKDGFSRGMTVGYKGKHEFEVAGNTMNAQGAEKLMDIVKSLVFAGVKQDPNMLGENKATTETFGRVILAKMLTQTKNFQNAVKAFLEDTFALELRLGFRYTGTVTVKFTKPLVGDQKREQETWEKKIANNINLYNQGLISQEELAERLDIDEPDLPVPRVTANAGGGGGGDEREVETTEEAENQRAQEALKNVGFGTRTFVYECPDGCAHEHPSFVNEFQDNRIERIINDYNSEVNRKYSVAIERALPGMRRAIAALPENASQQRIENIVVFYLIKDWDKNFTKRIDTDIRKNVKEAYNIYRKDKKVFQDAEGFGKSTQKLFTIPEASLDLLDFRTIEYLQDLDRVFLGKFITDPDTMTRVTRFIEEAYVSDNSPLSSPENLNKFMEDFGELVNNESWKARRIIETTINKARNYANVMYINQAEIKKFEVVEVVDQLTCQWCAYMDGQELEVVTEVEKIKDLNTGEITDIASKAPFATSIPIEQFEAMDAQAIQAAGIGTPPNHCHCRGRIVAVI